MAKIGVSTIDGAVTIDTDHISHIEIKGNTTVVYIPGRDGIVVSGPNVQNLINEFKKEKKP